MVVMLQAILSLDPSTGQLKYGVLNCTNRTLTIRRLNPKDDLVIRGITGGTAIWPIFGWPHPEIVVLGPGESTVASLDLIQAYLFSSAGTYRIAIDYRSTRSTKLLSREIGEIDDATAISAAVPFTVPTDALKC